jgi:hypothetical protein
MIRSAIFLSVAACIASPAFAQGQKADRNQQFWSEVKQLRETPEWKQLEKTTSVMQEQNAQADKGKPTPKKEAGKANAKAPKQESVRDRYIFNLSVDQPRDVARFMSDVTTNRIAGADGAISTVMNMRTHPQARQAAAKHIPPAARAQVTAYVERIPPGRYFSNIYATTSTTSAIVASPRPAAPAGYVPVRSPSFGCRTR